MSVPRDVELLAAIGRAMDVLVCFSIPLYRLDDRRPVLHGSGFFVRSGKTHFLVSAAHVFDNIPPGELFFYSKPNQLRHLTGSLVRSGRGVARDDDPIDIGVLTLTEDPQPPFPEVSKAAMDVSSLRPGRLPRENRNYVIIGFPETKNRADRVEKTISAAPYAYRSSSAPASAYAAHGRDCRTHLLLPLDLRRGFTPEGAIVHFPKPQGMSGSPIIVLYEEPSPDSEMVFPVVAVGTRYAKTKRMLIGTDVSYVLEAIARVA